MAGELVFLFHNMGVRTHRLSKTYSLCFICRAVVFSLSTSFFPPVSAREGDYVWKQLELHSLADSRLSALFAHCQAWALLWCWLKLNSGVLKNKTNRSVMQEAGCPGFAFLTPSVCHTDLNWCWCPVFGGIIICHDRPFSLHIFHSWSIACRRREGLVQSVILSSIIQYITEVKKNFKGAFHFIFSLSIEFNDSSAWDC